MEYLQEETKPLATPTILPAHLSEWRCLDDDTLWKSLVFILIPHSIMQSVVLLKQVSASVLIAQY